MDAGSVPVPAFDPSLTTSIGSPTDGRLVGGIPLPMQGRGFIFDPGKDPQRRHGTVELVGAIVRAAGRVAEQFPGGTLTVGDLSLVEGGEIVGHATHRNGRDVDVRFYLADVRGEPIASKAIPIEPDGAGTDYGDLADGADDVEVQLDTARTWGLMAALLSLPEARINRIYVVEHVRSILLEYARTVGADADIVERFGQVTCQPSFPHDDHMHIRFYCSLDDIDAGCEDTAPLYPWQQRYLTSHGRTFRPPTPHARGAKVTSVAEAEAKAKRKYGRFHPDVTAFLKRRKGWTSKPHPGRPYCP